MAEVTAGTIWGADDVARLRSVGMVRVQPPVSAGTQGPGDDPEVSSPAHPLPGSVLDADELTLRTVFWLALAGVPVTGEGLPASVRERLDPSLLDLLDHVHTDAVADQGERELLSLALRRRARAVTAIGARPECRPVVVLLPTEDEQPPTLLEDLARQSWPSVVRCAASDVEQAHELVAEARRQGALYCTRLRTDVRYGPHHLADLVDALRHSGAAVAYSPLRFRPWREGHWLESDPLAVECSALGGLDGGSLWYAEEGALGPADARGYAVHGANAVPAGSSAESHPVALRIHRRAPLVLDWLPEGPANPDHGGAPIPPSYFQRVGDPSRDRSASTASDS